jgi:hypothetical protein
VGRIEYRDYSVLVAIKAGRMFACGVGPLVSPADPSTTCRSPGQVSLRPVPKASTTGVAAVCLRQPGIETVAEGQEPHELSLMVDAWRGMEGRRKSNVKGSTALSHVNDAGRANSLRRPAGLQRFRKQCESCIQLRPIRMEQPPGRKFIR